MMSTSRNLNGGLVLAIIQWIVVLTFIWDVDVQFHTCIYMYSGFSTTSRLCMHMCMRL